MAKTVKIGFIGVGGIGRFQISHLVKLAGVEVLAAADVDRKCLDQVQKEYAVKKVFTDWRKLVKMPDLDAVSVCTPNKLHYRPTVAALQAGKHVLVEKPLAMNAREGQAMLDAARRSKKILQIAFQWRFKPAAQMLKKAREAGKFGKVLYVRCQALRRRGIPNWGVFGRKELQGGGPMIDIGVHILETAHYVMGSPKPVRASGSCYTYLGNKKSDTECPWPGWDYRTYNVEDLAVGYVKFADDSCLVIESSFAAHIENDVFNVQLMGTEGGGTYNPAKLFRDEAGYMMKMEPSFMADRDGFAYKMSHFVECVRGTVACEAPGEDGLMVQKMLDGIYRSAETGREVTIK